LLHFAGNAIAKITTITINDKALVILKNITIHKEIVSAVNWGGDNGQ